MRHIFKLLTYLSLNLPCDNKTKRKKNLYFTVFVYNIAIPKGRQGGI